MSVTYLAHAIRGSAQRGMLGFCLLLAATPALASFNGGLDLGFGFMFVAAFIIATPGSVLILLTERYGARLPSNPLFGYFAVGLVICSSALAHGWDNYNREPLFLLLVPPAGEVAIRTFIASPTLRPVAIWATAIISVSLGYFGLHGEFPGIVRDRPSLLGMLCGGAVSSLLFWHLGYYLGLRMRK